MSRDARFSRLISEPVTFSVGIVFLLLSITGAFGAEYETANFVVKNAPSAEMAREFGETAERCRAELASLWLGEILPDWAAKCPITVQVGPALGPGGSTSFVFYGGEVYGWKMNIQGSAERIGDSVLPHEITHMIFASYFRRALPRWLDEGGATSVEHLSEKENYRRMLREFLDPKVYKGLPFNKMVALRDYPEDPMPLYAQGFSVVEYLLAHGGHRRFIRFCERGLSSQNWSEAVCEFYGYENLGKLQTVWTEWIRSGCVAVDRFEPAAPYLAGLETAQVTTRRTTPGMTATDTGTVSGVSFTLANPPGVGIMAPPFETAPGFPGVGPGSRYASRPTNRPSGSR